MDPILVPKPKSIRDPDRPAGSLLLAQVRHLQKAERTLPPKYNSGFFHKEVLTEFEAARYVEAVTKAIHKAHDDAVRERRRRIAARKKVVEIAAEAKGPSIGKVPRAKKSRGKKSAASKPRKNTK